jgi:hypothetical protein
VFLLQLLLWFLASTQLLQFALKLCQARGIGLWRLPEFPGRHELFEGMTSTKSNYLGKMLAKIDVARCKDKLLILQN